MKHERVLSFAECFFLLKKNQKQNQPPCYCIIALFSTPLLGIQPKELKTGSQRAICTPVFTATLFTTAKIRRQHECLSINHRNKNVVYTYNGILLFSLEKEGNPAIW